MLSIRLKQALSVLVLSVSATTLVHGQQISAPEPQTGSINGTVTDTENDAIPGATITLTGPTPADSRTTKSSDTGFFELNDLNPGTYHILISMKDFSDWHSLDIVLKPGQDLDIPDINMQVGLTMEVTAIYSPVQIATEQVKVEEEQRVLGVIPNFYVVYTPDAAPLTPKLKFQLALKSFTDPITFAGAAMYAGIEQAANTPDFDQDWTGYGQRLGAAEADGFSDILIGGAILPTLLHQDPRYFYNGHGTKMHRFWYAVATPFICKGDNGHWEPNYSSVGGDLSSGAISLLYYPQSNRGLGLVLSSAAIGGGGRIVNALAQEFVLRKLTPKTKDQNPGGAN